MTNSLSEGISLLKLGHNSVGLPIHKAQRDEFITIRAARAQCLEEDHVMVNANREGNGETTNHFRVTIGEATFSLIFDENEGVIADGVPVYAGEEVWVSCSSPRKFVMYGIATLKA